MGCMSLKLAIAGIGGVVVAAAVMTVLGITVAGGTTSLDHVGVSYAEALALLSRDEVDQLYRRGTAVSDQLANLTRSGDWGYPSQDNRTYDAFDAVLRRSRRRRAGARRGYSTASRRRRSTSPSARPSGSSSSGTTRAAAAVCTRRCRRCCG